MSPHRIAFGITELDPGGAERMLVELVTRLDRGEWEPRVYCLGPDAHFAQVLRDREVPVTCFGATSLSATPAVLWRWTRELRRFRPEILFNWLFHASLLGRFAGRFAGVPHILSGVRVAERRRNWHTRLDRWTNGLVERNVCVSRGVADFLEQTAGFNPRKTVVIPNGIDPAPYESAEPLDLSEFGISPDSPVFVTIGRLEHQKGIDVLLEAIALVRSTHPHTCFLIVGEGPDRSVLEQQAQQRDIARQVRFLGRRHDVPRLLKAVTALILPSRWEGMPNVVLEAMAAGLPVIATQVEGIRELVRPDINGWVVPVENPPNLAAAIISVLSNSGQFSIMRQKSQHIIQKEFTIDVFTQNHIKLFRDLLFVRS